MALRPDRKIPFRFGNERWNVFVPTFAPQYDDLSELVKKALPNEFCCQKDGVWVPFGWLPDTFGRKKKKYGFKRLNGMNGGNGHG